ncbi:MAG: hypothetical protein KatS3mg124_1091 [Porticoccaceae bacterium]|nr:MAG: hypothetical protein KatS3mg124_1091 [Porticoccaceae bacterium]
MTGKGLPGARLAHQLARAARRDEGYRARLLDAAGDKASRLLPELARDAADLIRLAACAVRGEGPPLRRGDLALALFALAYLAIPADALPDWLPVTGLVDDAWVLAQAAAALRRQLAAFRAWQEAAAGR